MIESNTFTQILGDQRLIAAAKKRGLKVSCCGSAIILYNDFYGFFFLDVLNEDRLDAWVVDRLKIKQTHTITDLIWKFYDIKKCQELYKNIALDILDGDEKRSGLSSKNKFADYIFFMKFISDTLEGIEAGKMPVSDESLHPITEENWRKWSLCMALAS